ncbi:TetR/AcrR family transcriptional regulator [Actinosynnema pretiosum]|uniref:TetR family transcriptional regulator n=1 Tax=Actinosynnema pretiosum TaxID=42197 RepID=A0A290ZGM4_9PSEU|nr:TetR family transcriptional regulator [Actinosynnema pretiosum]ATE58168.1 TetR family transcriptional regulator [Actinosynnema pretiosum]
MAAPGAPAAPPTPPAPPAPTRRVDAQRNRARLLAVAEREIAVNGAGASLEQIARVAGVGSATARRHFPTRRALLEAVFNDQVAELCAHAHERADAADPRAALLEWLGELTAYAARVRGLSAALLRHSPTDFEVLRETCASDRLLGAGATLVARAADSLTPGTTSADLLDLVTGIALATEHHPDPAASAARLLDLAVAGISPRGA